MKANKELFRLEQELEEGYDAETLDSFCKYLYGVVLIKMQQTAKALTVLIESVHQYPYNWSAWLEIASCIPNEESVSAPFSSNILTLSFFFLAVLIFSAFIFVMYRRTQLWINSLPVS